MNELNKAIIKAAEELIDDADAGTYMEELDLRDLRNAVNARRLARGKAKLCDALARNYSDMPTGCGFDGETCLLSFGECAAVHRAAEAEQEARKAAAEDLEDDEIDWPCNIPDGDGDCMTCGDNAMFGCSYARRKNIPLGDLFGGSGGRASVTG